MPGGHKLVLPILRSLFRPREAAPTATIPAGRRAYAVGDIHGRRDLFAALIDGIENDNKQRGEADSTVVLPLDDA